MKERPPSSRSHPKRKLTRNKPASLESDQGSAIILLDQEPLRKEAADACAHEMARLENLRAQWSRFETEDQPLFGQWLMQTFGARLTELRESDQILREQESLVREIENEVYFGGARNYRAAYKIVMERRANPPDTFETHADTDWDSDPDEDDDDSDAPSDEPLSPEEAEALFQEYLRDVLDIHPRQLRKSEYAKLFGAFQRDILGQEPAPKNVPPKQDTHTSAEPLSAKGRKARIKEIYRLLVRKLHPDTQSGPKGKASGLWHEVQAAYEKEDLGRLEMLLALSETSTQAVTSATSLSQLRSVLKELERSSQAVLRSLSQAKKDMAWNFTQLKDRAPLEKRLRRQFETDRMMQLESLDAIGDLLAEWSDEPKPRKPKKPKEKTS
ncbi:MAG: J domain-containing protein [Verrucomicrobiota bacterium]